MAEQPGNYGSYLDGIALASGCSEVAAFDLTMNRQGMTCLHHARFGNQPDAAEKQSAINALAKIANVLLPAAQDAAVEIIGLSNSNVPFYAMVIFARRTGRAVGAATFVKQFATPELAEQALHELQTQTSQFRSGPAAS